MSFFERLKTQKNFPLVGSFFALALLLVPFFSFAQASREYHYLDINTSVDVRKDTTIKVQEEQLYTYTGTYHQGWRSIPHKDLGAITDVEVQDGETHASLQYSDSRLDKEDPASWGKYTVFKDNGATNIEWYYNVTDTTHKWVIEYVVHGALGFYNDHDELYWNLFTDYSVSVDHVEASITLPGEVTTPSASFYTTGNHTYQSSVPTATSSTFTFAASTIAPNESVTFAVGWQRGLVDRGAFWRDWFWSNVWGLLAAALILCGIIFVVAVRVRLWWLRPRRSIMPEYEPPEGQTPAVGQLVVKRGLNTATWPATLVNLAVRGYLKITKERREENEILWKSHPEGYLLELRRSADDAGLRDYEKELLKIFFTDVGSTFSTIDFKKEMQGSFKKQRGFQKKMEALKKTLYREAGEETGAFAVPLSSFSLFRERMSKEGFRLQDAWLGFKMYLYTAERFRVQNLTPELFEKFLPYAMIFGIEKQWAKNFDSLNMREPTWYGTQGYIPVAGISPGISGESFSASAFSASFSSSFSSAFASSAGGGASGGGGSAGGGGGGGGGGAS